LLNALVNRAGKATSSGDPRMGLELLSQDRQLMLEALLPQKEKMTKLAKQALSDSEAKVTAFASDALSAMAWWP
jgi:hypothetical protein